MTQDRLATELKAGGLWAHIEALQPLGVQGVRGLLMQDYVRSFTTSALAPFVSPFPRTTDGRPSVPYIAGLIAPL